MSAEHGAVELKRVRTADPAVLLRASVALARYATNGGIRALGDPVFDFVTEGRAVWSKYSSCGDLAQFVAWCLGCRDERIVNRDHDGGNAPWQTGLNLSKLIYGASGKLFTWSRRGILPVPGCMLYVAQIEHVCILDTWDASAGLVTTHDYGNWDYTKNLPAGKRCVNKLVLGDDGKWHIGARTLLGWLDYSKLPLAETPLVPLDFSEGTPDDNPYEEPGVTP